MRLHRCAPVIAIGVFLGYATAQNDILTPALNNDLKTECNEEAGFVSCRKALRQHGDGKDDVALTTLSEHQSPKVAAHYNIAKSRANEGFWKLVALAGAPAKCSAGLSKVLDHQFALDPGALGSADDDAGKSSFTALSDLLNIPPGGLRAVHEDGYEFEPRPRNEVADIYRSCFFNDSDNLFGMVKRKLGR
jgi:hypothetical protein